MGCPKSFLGPLAASSSRRRSRAAQLFAVALLFALEISVPAFGQQGPSPGVLTGPYGVPRMVQDDTETWEEPILVFETPGVQVFVPDFTGPTWAAWHIQRFGAHDFSYFLDVYTYYPASRQTAEELIYVDTRKPDQYLAFMRIPVRVTKNSVQAKVMAKITALLRPEADRQPAEIAAMRNYLQQERLRVADEIAHSGEPPIGASQAAAPSTPSTVKPPALLSSVSPQYTPAARRAKLRGTVLVSLLVDVHGKPQEVKVVKSLGLGLDEEAVGAVRQYEFTPAVNRATGEPVPFRMNVEVQFRIY